MCYDETLRQIIQQRRHRVILLKGPWGIGKTFFWEKFVNSHKQSLQLAGYSYVSLFGLEAVEALRTQVAANIVSLTAEEPSPLESCKQAVLWIKTRLAKHRDLAELPYASLPVIGHIVEETLLKDILVCFDDVERKGEGLSIGEFLGLVANLKEHRNCTVVIIYNDAAFEKNEGDAKVFSEYREKVVDCELSYRPLLDDNIAVVFGVTCPAAVRHVLTKLELNNIRVMLRIQWALGYFASIGASAFPSIQSALEFQVAAVTAIHYAHGASIDLGELNMLSYVHALMSKDEDEIKRIDPLKRIEFSPHTLTALVVEYHQNGYLDKEVALLTFERAVSERRIDEINESHRKIWERYHGNFECSQEEFVREHDAFLRENVEWLNLRDVAIAVQFLDEIMPSQNRHEILDAAIARIVIEHDADTIQQVDHGHFLNRVPENVVRRVMDGIEKKPSRRTSLPQLMEKLAGSDSWNSSSLRLLEQFTEADFLKWISAEKSIDVIKLLGTFISRFETTAEPATAIIKRIKAALDSIAKRSSLDKRRVDLVLKGR